MALFCIIFCIIIRSTLPIVNKIQALYGGVRVHRRRGRNNFRVSESPRQTFYPQKVTVHVT